MKFLLHAVVRMVVLGSVIIMLAFGFFEHPTFLQKLSVVGMLFVLNGLAVYLSFREIEWKNVRTDASLPPALIIAIVPFCVMIATGVIFMFIIWKNYF